MDVKGCGWPCLNYASTYLKLPETQEHDANDIGATSDRASKTIYRREGEGGGQASPQGFF